MAALVSSLVAHQEKVLQLANSLSAEKASGTFLFVGPEGVGRKASALALAQKILCEKKTGCGQCGSCLRVERQNHESLLLVSKDGTQIKIDQALQVIEFLHLQTWSGRRVIIIDEAQTMNLSAANALLKVLEEPPQGCIFILIAPSAAALMPTIRSRARVVSFRSLTPAELKSVMVAPDWAYRAARGSLSKLKSLLDVDESQDRLDGAGVLSAFFETPTFLQESFWRDHLKEKNRFARWLDLWSSLLRDALVLQWQGTRLVINSDLGRPLQGLMQQPRNRLLHALARLQDFEQDLKIHRDPQLCLEQLWVEIHHSSEL